jgi:hypothetical protein
MNEEKDLQKFCGWVTCDSPNEFLDKWDGNITVHKDLIDKVVFNVGYLFKLKQ